MSDYKQFLDDCPNFRETPYDSLSVIDWFTKRLALNHEQHIRAFFKRPSTYSSERVNRLPKELNPVHVAATADIILKPCVMCSCLTQRVVMGIESNGTARLTYVCPRLECKKDYAQQTQQEFEARPAPKRSRR
jgi:hypothetical protein